MNNDVMHGANTRIRRQRTDLQMFFAAVYQNVALGLLLCGGVSFFVSTSPALMNMIFNTPLRFLVLFAPLILSFYLSSKIQELSVDQVQMLYWVYVALIGVMISSVFLIYTFSSISSAFFISGGVFIGASFYGRTTQGDLSKMSSILMVGLFGIIIASLINLFIGSSTMSMLISALSVIIFTGLIAYENQSLQNLYYYRGSEDDKEKLAVLGAMTLFISFINIFLSILRLMGTRRD